MIFFISQSEINDEIQLIDDDFRHMCALRPRNGDVFTLSDNKEYVYSAKITGATKKHFSLIITDKKPIEHTNIKKTLFMALLKGEKNEYVIQKCSELGIDSIVFYCSTNTVARLTGKETAKTDRFNKIAKMAAMQSESPLIPEVVFIDNFDDSVKALKDTKGIFFYEHAESLLSEWLVKNKTSFVDRIGFMIGPEGGFTPTEVGLVEENQIPILSLGNRILKADTAPITALSVIKAFLGEL